MITSINNFINNGFCIGFVTESSLVLPIRKWGKAGERENFNVPCMPISSGLPKPLSSSRTVTSKP